MLRHSVFALILVGAAFAGGAAINGPGLAWLQRTVLGGPTIIVDGSPAGPAAKKPRPFPTAKASPLVVDLPQAAPKSKPKPAGPEADPGSPAPSPELASDSASPPIPTPTADAPPPDLGLAPPPASDGPPPIDPTPSAKTDPVARLASASTPVPAPTSPSPPAPTSDWAGIRERLRALGVARYSMEAETGGHVRFTCVIPLDGLRAVGQQFEAEGDDEFQAAEAALRRITLWRATEGK